MTLFDASFRGKPFQVFVADDEGGRRTIVHEYPGRDVPYAEDNGLQTKRFTIEAQLIGPSYRLELQDLEEALDTPGPGLLVHPERGEIEVAVDGRYRTRQSTAEGGMARVTIPFVIAGEISSPTITVDTPSNVQIQRTAVNTSLVKSAPSIFSVAGELGYLTTQASSKMAFAGSRLTAVRARIESIFGVVDDAKAAIDQFTKDLNAIIRAPETLVSKFTGLMNKVFGSMESIAVEAATVGARGDALLDSARVDAAITMLNEMGTFGDDFEDIGDVQDLPGETVFEGVATPSRTQEQRNQEFLRDMVQAGSLGEALAAIANLPLESVEQGEEIREQVDARFEALFARGTLDDGVDAALRDLRAAFYRHLIAATAELSVLTEYTPAATVPAILIAYRLYGDVSLENDILQRNPQVENPCFVPGGQPLQVLSNG